MTQQGWRTKVFESKIHKFPIWRVKHDHGIEEETPEMGDIFCKKRRHQKFWASPGQQGRNGLLWLSSSLYNVLWTIMLLYMPMASIFYELWRSLGWSNIDRYYFPTRKVRYQCPSCARWTDDFPGLLCFWLWSELYSLELAYFSPLIMSQGMGSMVWRTGSTMDITTVLILSQQ